MGTTLRLVSRARHPGRQFVENRRNPAWKPAASARYSALPGGYSRRGAESSFGEVPVHVLSAVPRRKPSTWGLARQSGTFLPWRRAGLSQTGRDVPKWRNRGRRCVPNRQGCPQVEGTHPSPPRNVENAPVRDQSPPAHRSDCHKPERFFEPEAELDLDETLFSGKGDGHDARGALGGDPGDVHGLQRLLDGHAQPFGHTLGGTGDGE